MKAKVTKSFVGAKDGEHYPIKFAIGDTVEGKLAKVAVEEGWAEAEPKRSRGAAAEQQPELMPEPSAGEQEAAEPSSSEAPAATE